LIGVLNENGEKVLEIVVQNSKTEAE